MEYMLVTYRGVHEHEVPCPSGIDKIKGLKDAFCEGSNIGAGYLIVC